MDTRALQELVRASHDRTFRHTELRERLRDLAQQVAELSHHRDAAHLEAEAGDVAWSLLQLLNERGLALDEVVTRTIRKLDDRQAGRSIALLGTSASPITNAHLTVALEVLALTDVDEVWFLLAGQHPWGKKLMPAQHRLEMVRLAIRRYPRLRACDFEIVHGERIYESTRETAFILRDHLLPAYPGHRFSWVMGSDVAQSFHEWGGAEWMAEHLDCIVLHRLGYDFDKEHSLLKDGRHRYFKEDVVTSNISSSLVRARGRTYEHEKLVALVPEVVWEHLLAHRLLDPDVLR
jgi:nicotinate (nicotinamide) nucleotide adenylyltransferase